MKTGNIFLLSWDCQGLESVVNISNIEREIMWNTLQEHPLPDLNKLVSNIMLRAKFNPQRHYEIYTVHVDISITEDDLRQMFSADPQGCADLVRASGNKIYSDRHKPNEVKIT